MIDYVNKGLFEDDSINKQFIIEVSDGQVIDNTILYENSFTLTESICTSKTLKFGGCNASSIKFRIRNGVLSLVGKTLVVKIIINHDTDNPFYLGTYKVDSDVYAEGRIYRDVIAYDFLYEICNTDITEWYKSQESDSLYYMYTKFCNHFGIEYENTWSDFPLSSMLVKIKNVDKLDGRTFLQDFFEINGCFGYVTRGNKLKAIYLSQYKTAVKEYKKYKSTQYEDYFAEPIIKLTIVEGDVTAGAKVDDGNEYIIENNLFTYNQTEQYLNYYASMLFTRIRYCKYKIMTDLNAKGNPCIEVGDRIWVTDKDVQYDTFVLSRTLTGIQAMRDEITADGTQYQENVTRRKTTAEQTKANTEAIRRMANNTLKVVWVSSESQVGTDPYTFYCIEK